MMLHLLAIFLIFPLSASQFISPAGINRKSKVTRYSAECTETQIDLSLDFDTPFRGLIYSEGSNCVYVNGFLNPQTKYIANVPLTGCKTTRKPDGTWENNVIVQQDYTILEVSDQKFQVLCAPGISASTDDKFTVSFTGVKVNSDLKRVEKVSGTGSSGGLSGGPLQYSVEVQQGLGPDGPKIAGPISVGQSISYVVRLPDPRARQARIGKCWAEDGISKMTLSDDNGCSLQNTGNVWNDFQAAEINGEKVFYTDIKAWGFPTSDRVNIYCNLHFCPGPCPTYNCQRLKRRDAPIHYPTHLGQYAKPETTQVNAGSDMVEIVGGGFEIEHLGRQANDVLTAEKVGFHPGPAQLVTGAPSIESEPTSSSICLAREYFGVGIALLCLIVIISVLFVIMASYRLLHRSKMDDRAMSITSSEGVSQSHNENVTFNQSQWMRNNPFPTRATMA